MNLHLEYDGDKSFDELYPGFRDRLADKPSVVDQAVELFESLSRDSLIERIKSGELDNSTPLSLPPGVRDKLVAIFESSKRSLEEDTLVWFTYRVDENNQSWVSWPIVSYAPGVLIDPYELPSVVKALSRIRTRGNIVDIKVTGRLPRYHYFGRSTT